MKTHLENRILTIYLEGQIDSNNANDISEDIDKVLAANDFTNLVIDCDQLKYISSAGLRLLLKIAKEYQDTTLTNVSPEVYETLDITGFIELLNVKRKLRKFSVEDLTPFDRGATSSIYKIKDDNILKVFNPGFDKQVIFSEREKAQSAFIDGIATAIPYDVVEVGDSLGIIYEMLNAKSLLQTMLEDKSRVPELAEMYANFCKAQHSIELDTSKYQSAKDLTTTEINNMDFLNSDEKRIVNEIVMEAPDRNTFVHGDLHPGNVMFTNDELLMIDLGDIGYGDPIFDLGWWYYIRLSKEFAKRTQGPSFLPIEAWEIFDQVYPYDKTMLEVFAYIRAFIIIGRINKPDEIEIIKTRLFSKLKSI